MARRDRTAKIYSILCRGNTMGRRKEQKGEGEDCRDCAYFNVDCFVMENVRTGSDLQVTKNFGSCRNKNSYHFEHLLTLRHPWCSEGELKLCLDVKRKL